MTPNIMGTWITEKSVTVYRSTKRNFPKDTNPLVLCLFIDAIEFKLYRVRWEDSSVMNWTGKDVEETGRGRIKRRTHKTRYEEYHSTAIVTVAKY
jgi:hypothetical protein